jgi:hypothetical protein
MGIQDREDCRDKDKDAGNPHCGASYQSPINKSPYDDRSGGTINRNMQCDAYKSLLAHPLAYAYAKLQHNN